MLDFIFRRGNPTNSWQRSPNLSLIAALDEPSLNSVKLGARLDQLSSLGRSDETEFETLCYFDLGVGIDHQSDGTLGGYTVVVNDEDSKFRSYQGQVTWKQSPLKIHKLSRDELPGVLGDWYWLDSDEEESIAFFEYPGYEMQVELTLDGAIKRFILTNKPLMADQAQREAYEVTEPWPPQRYSNG